MSPVIATDWSKVLVSSQAILRVAPLGCGAAAPRLSRSSKAGGNSLSPPHRFPSRESDLLSVSPPRVALRVDRGVSRFQRRAAGSVDGSVIGDSPTIEDVFARISPRLCAPLHHCVPVLPPSLGELRS
ncbi:unnamed protein product [Pleuronectes platessa]|uniref:Uncharacterized protein n=1 Tax=Pleuronectes platessa TaxID=8262 RepID=A0A9N7VM55_PLEPL|nr:unnamed protein product [Pleuronectes platessa]